MDGNLSSLTHTPGDTAVSRLPAPVSGHRGTGSGANRAPRASPHTPPRRATSRTTAKERSRTHGDGAR